MKIQAHTLTTTAKDGTTLLSYVAMPHDSSGKLPSIMVAPEWWGAEDTHPKNIAIQLAELGFAVCLMDIYGEGKLTTDAGQANTWMTQMLDDPYALMDRCAKIYHDFVQLDVVDGARVGVIGYCFGGKLALDMARLAHEQNTPIQAVATFHGNPTPIRPADNHFKAKVLVAHGAKDSMVSMEGIHQLEAELGAVGASCHVDVYEDAKHGFSNPLADKRAQENGIDLGYHETTAKQSFEKMVKFMQENL